MGSIGLIWAIACAASAAETSDVAFVEENGAWRVSVQSSSGIGLFSPQEGLWSVAMDWRDDWPCEWRHAKASKMEKQGEWTLLSGILETPKGNWVLRDSYRPDNGLVRCTRRFEWHGREALSKCTLSVRFQSPGTGSRVMMPGILYYGNPSGAKSGRVPVYAGNPGDEAIFEEHRFPMPYVSLEWPEAQNWRGAALHTLPSPAPCGHIYDQWWSMGLCALKDGSEFVLFSGPCASNGRRSVVKAVQPGFVPYPDTWLDVKPGTIIEKTFWLDTYAVEREGSGFCRPTHTSLQLNAPRTTPAFPRAVEIIGAKWRFAQSRWHEDGDAAGFRKFPDKNILVMGWCGQADAMGYALPVLADRLSAPDVLEKARKTMDFLSTAKFYDGGFHTWYDCDKKEWSHDEPLSQAQAMLSFAHAIPAAARRGVDTAKWDAFLKKACAFHAKRILAPEWSPRSTDQAFFIAPLCAGYERFGDDSMRNAAVRAGDTYGARCVSMKEPYWGGTLDAQCEDKEGAFAALQGFLALFDMTKDAKYLDWARHACDVVLSYTVVWDIDLPAGRIRDHNLKTRGWTVVSPQNQHIDVFGVLIAPWVYRIGALTDDASLKDLAILMYRSCGQGIDPFGSQGEQLQQTNYAQRGDVGDMHALRGGYSEDWTVFWITAHFLNAAAIFDEMGVSLDE